jgi:hypothetical protein
MFENDPFFTATGRMHKLASPPIFRGLLLSRPRCNFAVLVQKGSAFAGTLKQSLEVSLQNVTKKVHMTLQRLVREIYKICHTPWIVKMFPLVKTKDL